MGLKELTQLSDFYFHFHSLHTIQSVHLQCTIHGFKYIHRCAVIFRTFSSLHKETSIPPPLSPHPIPFAATSLPLALSFSCSGHFLQMESHTCGLLWTLLLLNPLLSRPIHVGAWVRASSFFKGQITSCRVDGPVFTTAR